MISGFYNIRIRVDAAVAFFAVLVAVAKALYRLM